MNDVTRPPLGMKKIRAVSFDRDPRAHLVELECGHYVFEFDTTSTYKGGEKYQCPNCVARFTEEV